MADTLTARPPRPVAPVAVATPRLPFVAGLLRRHGGLLATVATIAVAVQAFRSFVVAPLTGAFSGDFEDFEAYWDAATSASAGHSPYATFDQGTVTMSGFIYPPFGAMLARPLALLDHHAAATLFLWIGLACLVVAGVVLARTVLPATWPAARLGLCTVLVFPPATYNLFHGQANPIVFLLLALALHAYVTGKEIRCGTLLGVAAAIKLAPFVLIVLLLRRRWWRGSAALAGSAAAASLLGVATMGVASLRTWMSLVLPSLGRDNGWVFNQTWDALVSRLADHSVLAWDASAPLLHALALGAAAAGIGLAAWGVRPGERASEERALEFGGLVAAMVLAGSIAWYAHGIHLLVPLLALVGFATRRPAVIGRAALWAAAFALGVLAVFMPWLIAGTTMGGLLERRGGGGTAWWLYLQLWSLPVAATAVLLGACAWSLSSGRRWARVATAQAAPSASHNQGTMAPAASDPI